VWLRSGRLWLCPPPFDTTPTGSGPFGEHRRRNDGADSLVIKGNDLAAATATDLARALRAARRHDEEPYAGNIDLAPDDEYSPKNTVVDPISFKMLDDGRLAIRISLTSDDNFEDQNRLCVVIEPLIDPLLRRSAGQLVAVGVNRYRTTAPPEWFNAQDYPTAKPRNATVTDRAAAAMIGPGAFQRGGPWHQVRCGLTTQTRQAVPSDAHINAYDRSPDAPQRAQSRRSRRPGKRWLAS